MPQINELSTSLPVLEAEKYEKMLEVALVCAVQSYRSNRLIKFQHEFPWRMVVTAPDMLFRRNADDAAFVCFFPTAWQAWGSSNKASGWFGAAARNLAPASARFRIQVPFLKVDHEVPQGSTVKSSGSTTFHVKVPVIKVQVPQEGSTVKNSGNFFVSNRQQLAVHWNWMKVFFRIFSAFLRIFFPVQGSFSEFFSGGGLVGSSATGALGLDVWQGNIENSIENWEI